MTEPALACMYGRRCRPRARCPFRAWCLRQVTKRKRDVLEFSGFPWATYEMISVRMQHVVCMHPLGHVHACLCLCACLRACLHTGLQLHVRHMWRFQAHAHLTRAFAASGRLLQEKETPKAVERADKLKSTSITAMLDLFDLPKDGNKLDKANRLVNYLIKPKDEGKKDLAALVSSAPRMASPSRRHPGGVAWEDRSEIGWEDGRASTAHAALQAEKKKDAKKRKAERIAKKATKKGKKAATQKASAKKGGAKKEDSEDEEDDDDESEEESEEKSQGEEESEEEPIAKKAKKEPTPRKEPPAKVR
eukprot:228450-Chlamydomonas_euryale.AAC.12